MRKQIESISRYIFPLYDEKISIWRYGSEHQCVAAPFSLLSHYQLPHSGCVGQWPWALACPGYIFVASEAQAKRSILHGAETLRRQRFFTGQTPCSSASASVRLSSFFTYGHLVPSKLFLALLSSKSIVFSIASAWNGTRAW